MKSNFGELTLLCFSIVGFACRGRFGANIGEVGLSPFGLEWTDEYRCLVGSCGGISRVANC